MSLLEHPKAQQLLADAELTPASVRRCQEHLTQFLQRYLPLFYRQEQRDLATLVIQGRLSGLERKTSEPRPCPVGPDDGILRFARPLAEASRGAGR